MEIIKKNITFILALLVPLLMILLIVASIYLPRIFIDPPQYDFLYSVNNNSIDGKYFIENGKIVEREQVIEEDEKYRYPIGDSKLFFYDIEKNKSREISFEEALSFNLDSRIISPDGFEVVYGERISGLFFSSSGLDSLYIKGHGLSQKLNLGINYSYYYGFKFIGWVIN